VVSEMGWDGMGWDGMGPLVRSRGVLGNHWWAMEHWRETMGWVPDCWWIEPLFEGK